MVQTGMPQKRNLLYEMLLKLSGIDKRVKLSQEAIEKELSSIKSDLSPFLVVYPRFLQILLQDILEYLSDKLKMEKIENHVFLESIHQDLRDIPIIEKTIKTLQEQLLQLILQQIQRLRPETFKKEEKRPDTLQLMQYLLINLDRIEKSLDKLLVSQSSEDVSNYEEVIDLFRHILDKIVIIEENSEGFRGIISEVKQLNQKLKYKKASIALALINRGFKQGRLTLERSLNLLKFNIKAELIRATILMTLKTFGSLNIVQIAEKTKIDQQELLVNLYALLDRRELTVTTIAHTNTYSIAQEQPKLYRFLSKEIESLKGKKEKFPISSRAMLTAVASITTSILEKTLKVGPESDKVYENNIESLSENLRQINDAIAPSETVSTRQPLQYKIAALLELFNMFRVRMVHEKEPYLIEQSEDEKKQKQLDNFILTAVKIDFERGLLLSILKEKGPLNILDLSKISEIPQNKVVRHILKLVKDKVINLEGKEGGYFLYDIPRILTEIEIKVQGTCNSIVSILNIFVNLNKDHFVSVDNLSKILRSLEMLNLEFSRLLELDLESSTHEKLQDQLKQINPIIEKCRLLEQKLPKTKSKFDLTKLAMMSLPRTDEEHADLIDPLYMVGFGDIEWDINKCLACASCQEICPEAAVTLTNEWDLHATFEMPDKSLEELPENRKHLVKLIKKLAVKKPINSIKLPKDTLGFGKIEYNPLICIACRKCEERCPNTALTFQEFWNFPEIMKSLLEEK